MLDIIQKHLQKVPLFCGLTEQELQPIVNISYIKNYNSKSFVFMQGDNIDRVFFILSGKIKIQKTDPTGKEQIVNILETGEMFPHAGFFRKGSYPANAEVLENTRLIVTSIADFEQILISNPGLCIKMFRILGEKIIDLQNRLEEQILHDTYQQVVGLFQRLCISNGILLNDKYKITTYFTNRDLANMIGSTRETVNRIINRLRKENLIELDVDGLFLVDLNKMKEEIS